MLTRVTLIKQCPNLKYEDSNKDHHYASRVSIATVVCWHQTSCLLNLDPDCSVGKGDDGKSTDLNKAENGACQATTWCPQIKTTPGTNRTYPSLTHSLNHLITWSHMNEWKRLLAEFKNIKWDTNNNLKQYIYQRCYQVTKNINGRLIQNH